MTTYLLGARLGKVTQSPACDLEKPYVLSTMGGGGTLAARGRGGV